MGDVSELPTTTQKIAPVQEGIASSTTYTHSQSNEKANHPAQDPKDRYREAAFSSQYQMPVQADSRPVPYNMGPMTAALPQAGYRPNPYPQNQQRYSGQPVVGQMPPMPQYPGTQAAMGPMPGQGYYMSQHPQMPGYYMAPISSQQQTRMPTQPAYYPGQTVMPSAPHMGAGFYYPPTGQYPVQHQAMPTGQYMTAPSNHHDHQSQVHHHATVPGTTSSPIDGSRSDGNNRSDIVRGPPRKPKQSGHAIWIGNLPPQTDLMQLVHHVCHEAKGLESLFLISKSNCAFANFKDEETCMSAQQKLHDSKFQTVRLVSRLRKSTVEGASGLTAPTGPAAIAIGSAGSSATNTPHDKSEATSQDGDAKSQSPIVSSTKLAAVVESTSPKDRFFILKSLTVEDLELSIRTGIWATQAHNEESLNTAFQTSDNIYLVFSANKSGEYFGYARMTSEMNSDPAAAIEFAPKTQSANDLDLPRAIPTEATEFAPKGRIIDDSARGAIFWEAERDDEEDSTGGVDGGEKVEEKEAQEVKEVKEDEATTETKEEQQQQQDGSGSIKSDEEEQKAWGKPFTLEWLSTARLPFYRTRGLRNPWNSNREVKIARDGTELEPSVGRRLIGLFNRSQSPVPAGMRPNHGVSPVSGYPPPPQL